MEGFQNLLVLFLERGGPLKTKVTGWTFCPLQDHRSQLTQLAAAPGFLMGRGAALDAHHRPVVSCDGPQRWAKLSPKTVGSEMKAPSLPRKVFSTVLTAPLLMLKIPQNPRWSSVVFRGSLQQLFPAENALDWGLFFGQMSEISDLKP